MKYKALFILFAIALISSVILTATPTAPICSTGCDLVQNSDYAFTFGIKNSTYGIVIFAALLLLTILYAADKKPKHRHMIHIAIIVGSVISLYFIYLQVFVLKAYCIYCLIADIAVLLALIIAIWKWDD